eukprot:1095246-Rhodomonas_salina.1
MCIICTDANCNIPLSLSHPISLALSLLLDPSLPPSLARSSALALARALSLKDLGGVVLNSPLPAIHAFEKKAGLPQDSIFTAAARAGDGGAFQQLERGEIQLKECYSLLSQDLGAPPLSSAGLTGTAQLSELFAEMEKSFFPPRPEMLDAIQCIRVHRPPRNQNQNLDPILTL